MRVSYMAKTSIITVLALQMLTLHVSQRILISVMTVPWICLVQIGNLWGFPVTSHMVYLWECNYSAPWLTLSRL
eukprot:gene24821-31206_t